MNELLIALPVVGAALLVAEAHLPTYGILGFAGVGALIAAVVLAVIESGGSPILAVAVAIPLALASAGLVAVVARKGLEVSRQKARGGAESLVGHVGVVRRPLEPMGQVFVSGELWRARPCWGDEDEQALREGEPVVVERVRGLTLSVRRAEEWELES